jgi:hypothetical protein
MSFGGSSRFHRPRRTLTDEVRAILSGRGKTPGAREVILKAGPARSGSAQDLLDRRVGGIPFPENELVYGHPSGISIGLLMMVGHSITSLPYL